MASARLRKVVVVVAAIIVLGTGAVLTWRSITPPAMKINPPVPYVMRLNNWRGKIPESLSSTESLVGQALAGKVPTVDYATPITFDFGLNKPDKISLKVDYYTNPLSSHWIPPEEVKVEGLTFRHPPSPSRYKGLPRFYILTAQWGTNTIEYAFAVTPTNEPGKDKLTMDAVRALAKGALTAADIVDRFEGRDITSGVHSFYSELPDDFALMIGYAEIAEPFYVHLIDTRNNTRIDPRTEDTEKFIKR